LKHFYKSKKILVAGGSGFVGINLANKLAGFKANVVASYNKNFSFKKNSNVKYRKYDFLQPDQCKEACNNIDYVFMCAANTSGAKVISSTPLVHLTPNMIMNMNMLEAAYETGVKKFLFISSNTVYPLTDYPVKEDDITNEFFDAYHIVGWMKRFTEIVCDMYSNKIKKPMNTVIVRPGNLYGPHDKFDPEKSKVIPALITRAVKKQNPFNVWGDGKDLKDFIYIDDYIDGMLLAMQKLSNSTPINIASGQPITIREVLKYILKASNHLDAEIFYDSSKPSMIPKRIIDISFAKKMLDWQPKISIEEGIKKTVNWYLNEVDNPQENLNDNK